MRVNFTDEDSAFNFFNNAVKQMGDVDVPVNCAAMYARGPFLEITAKQLSLMHQVNSETPMALIQLFARHCIDRNKSGSIINISSISGTMPSINSTLNSCSKASLNMLTKSAALELAKHNIRVNAIALGLVDTDSNYDFKVNDPSNWECAISEIPLGRADQPVDCAKLAVFLASGQSSWITGAIIPVDGGMTISWKG